MRPGPVRNLPQETRPTGLAGEEPALFRAKAGDDGETAAGFAPVERGFVPLTTHRRLGKAPACVPKRGHTPLQLLGVGHESSGGDTTAYRQALRQGEGGFDYELPLDSFRGAVLQVRLEARAGGERDWCCEFAAVSDFSIHQPTGPRQ